MRPQVVAFIALGANLGDAAAAVRAAFSALDDLPDTQVQATSRLYRSAAWQTEGPDFINAVARLSTGLTAPDLLAALLALENQAGRTRPAPGAPRTLDLDLLLYGDATMFSPSLLLPHPRLSQRAFVLRPLHDVAPDRVTPTMLQAVADQRIEVLT